MRRKDEGKSNKRKKKGATSNLDEVCDARRYGAADEMCSSPNLKLGQDAKKKTEKRAKSRAASK